MALELSSTCCMITKYFAVLNPYAQYLLRITCEEMKLNDKKIKQTTLYFEISVKTHSIFFNQGPLFIITISQSDRREEKDHPTLLTTDLTAHEY